MRSLGKDLAAEAYSETDGVIEAIRRTAPGFVLGVQWHPEFLRPGDADVLDCTPILDSFLDAARAAA